MINSTLVANYYKITIIFLITIFTFCGCKYGNIVTIEEQIAIYQNMGFIKIDDPQSNLTIQNINLKISNINEINNYFIVQNIDCKISNLSILYLPLNANSIASLIFVYLFNDNNNAHTFYNTFYLNLKNSLFIKNNIVVQKGIGTFISNGAENYKYFIDFCNGVK